jgi:hypothetical protein
LLEQGLFIVVVVASLFGIVVLPLDVFLSGSLARFACNLKIGNLLEGGGVGGVLRDGWNYSAVWLLSTWRQHLQLYAENETPSSEIIGQEVNGAASFCPFSSIV